MPTIEETLDTVLLDAIKIYTHQCFRCKGEGTVRDYMTTNNEPESTKTCAKCNGAKIIVPTLDNNAVCASIFSSVIVAAAISLEQNDFDRCVRAVEWGKQLWIRVVATHGGTMEDIMKEYCERLSNSPLNEVLDPHPVDKNSALSKGELKDLGIDDDQA